MSTPSDIGCSECRTEGLLCDLREVCCQNCDTKQLRACDINKTLAAAIRKAEDTLLPQLIELSQESDYQSDATHLLASALKRLMKLREGDDVNKKSEQQESDNKCNAESSKKMDSKGVGKKLNSERDATTQENSASTPPPAPTESAARSDSNEMPLEDMLDEACLGRGALSPALIKLYVARLADLLLAVVTLREFPMRFGGFLHVNDVENPGCTRPIDVTGRRGVNDLIVISMLYRCLVCIDPRTQRQRLYELRDVLLVPPKWRQEKIELDMYLRRRINFWASVLCLPGAVQHVDVGLSSSMHGPITLNLFGGKNVTSTWDPYKGNKPEFVPSPQHIQSIEIHGQIFNVLVVEHLDTLIRLARTGWPKATGTLVFASSGMPDKALGHLLASLKQLLPDDVFFCCWTDGDAEGIAISARLEGYEASGTRPDTQFSSIELLWLGLQPWNIEGEPPSFMWNELDPSNISRLCGLVVSGKCSPDLQQVALRLVHFRRTSSALQPVGDRITACDIDPLTTLLGRLISQGRLLKGLEPEPRPSPSPLPQKPFASGGTSFQHWLAEEDGTNKCWHWKEQRAAIEDEEVYVYGQFAVNWVLDPRNQAQSFNTMNDAWAKQVDPAKAPCLGCYAELPLRDKTVWEDGPYGMQILCRPCGQVYKKMNPELRKTVQLFQANRAGHKPAAPKRRGEKPANTKIGLQKGTSSTRAAEPATGLKPMDSPQDPLQTLTTPMDNVGPPAPPPASGNRAADDDMDDFYV